VYVIFQYSNIVVGSTSVGYLLKILIFIHLLTGKLKKVTTRVIDTMLNQQF